MLIKATLSNAMHPEYGEVTIPFPIKTSEYDRTMEMLANLKIGDAMGRDCKIMELSSPYSILQKLEYSEVNIDELDYLAKRLESFEADQDLQFQAAAFARGVASIEDFINLTFCSDQATVIYDFTKLEEAGRQHFMNLHGGCASTEELENLDGYETALLLIDGGGAEITPYGVLYDNGMQMEQLYKGGPFPPYLYDAYELVLPVSPTQSPQNKTYLYLPSSNLQLERTLLRGGIMEREGWFHKLEPIQLSSVITAKLDTRRDSIRELNEMCRSIHRKLYEQAGMSESAIDEIYTYDWRCFCSQRTYENRTQPLPDLYISDEGQSVRSSLLKKFPALSTTFDEQDFPGQYAWIDTIEDPDLFRKINLLSNADLELLTLLVIHGYSEAEIARQRGCSRNTISKKFARIKRFLK